MSEPVIDHRLTAVQMAEFVRDGYLMLDGFVPAELNAAVHADQQADIGYWDKSSAIHAVFDYPPVKGILNSLLGASPVYDHSALHVVGGGKREAQVWHADSIIDARPFAFDVQSMYFSHDVPKETGPTLILPGSHLRRVSNVSIGRYKNIVGQKQLSGRAGAIAFLHHGLWHCAQPNQIEATRYMFKLRLRPGEPQRGLFNTAGIDSPEIHSIINSFTHKWMGDEARAETVQRAKLWRYVCGDDNVDASFEGVLTRMGL